MGFPWTVSPRWAKGCSCYLASGVDLLLAVVDVAIDLAGADAVGVIGVLHACVS